MPTDSVQALFLAVLVRPNLRSLSDENGQGVAVHVDDCPLFFGLEIFDLAQVAVCNRLTDVDQPFSGHLFQSLLWQMGEEKPLRDEFVRHVLELKFFKDFKINPYQRKYNHVTHGMPI